MEQIRKNSKKDSLRKAFIYAVFCTVFVILVLSGLTIWGCVSFCKWLIPESNAVFLNVITTYEDGSTEEMGTRLSFGEEAEEIPNLIITKDDKDENDGSEVRSIQYSLDKIENNVVCLNVTITYKDGSTEERKDILGFGEEAVEEKMSMAMEEGSKDRYDDSGTKSIRYSVDKMENSFTALSPKRKIAYTGSVAAMVVLPMLYSVVGILVCAFWFYKKKLDGPIQILSEATENIAAHNLDFHVEYDSTDEMGALCSSFENMRQALYENNRKLWNMLEEHKMLQASVAHDLRNPIAIIEGYTEYLQVNLPTGGLDEERLETIVSNLSASAKRLERYTDSIRDINHLEDLEIHPLPGVLPGLLDEMTEDFTVMAKRKGIMVKVLNDAPKKEVMLDEQVLFRVLENIFTNALRYAKNTIYITFTVKERKLVTVVEDDGPGFPEKILNKKGGSLFSMDQSSGHMGMGLVICRILCKKHGGELKLANRSGGGAAVTIEMEIL